MKRCVRPRGQPPTPLATTRLKGALGTATWKGSEYERWQYEVTGGGRIWFFIDDERRTVWIKERVRLRHAARTRNEMSMRT